MSVLERIYFFHTRIQSGRYPNTGALVQEFEISPATAHRDVAYLRDRLLAPLAFDQKKNGYYYTRDDFRLPFEDSQPMTLVLGLLNRLGEETGLTGVPELERMHNRLQGIIFPGERDFTDLLHCEWSDREPVDSTVFSAVLCALRERTQLRMLYRAASGRTSTRTIEPLKLVNYQGRWYILAWCTTRDDRRLFHLSRMSEIQMLNNSIEHTLKNGDNWLTESFGIFKGPARFKATIRFTGLAAEIVSHQQWHPDQKRWQEADGVQLTLPVADDRELIMKVLQFGSQAEILEPKGLREKLQKEIRRMNRLYRS